MFNSGSKQSPRETPRESARPADPGRFATVIGDGARIEGSIKVSGSLRVDGDIEGGAVMTSENLSVGGKGKIRADLTVKQAMISGTVEGKIRARDRVELLAGAHVRGDVYAQSFKIEDGVFFHGTCVMGEAAASELEATSPTAMRVVQGGSKQQPTTAKPGQQEHTTGDASPKPQSEKQAA
jgi:cytoskeletal protein CcmA (bactofilin family)